MGNLKIEHINPDGLIKNPAFTNVVTVQGNAKTIYIGEINANNEAGEVIGKDMKTQTEQVLKNIGTALQAAGADWENLIKWTIYVLQGQDIRPGFEAFQKIWGNRPNPPLITVMFVAALGRPEHLVGIEAIAVVP
ncbi:RidA family protein [Chitinophaga niabensis]|uniref:Enamine deaminase RidA, house cleaning of reactive enamine intermediates, YjgF/YER057c/UK114 family n=1 Tax=Chitinophaga niabensis TaxID=536979 RepID=A0A1N6J1B8_9BACT|nr:RidA family protein [Chitinophaga niabensis]SIO37906.1 Enamine deaminase RidA, house cleaning of reactive enamine intermediates, YjgF/YER057c/UK114 family [Chitinophaga niabensis]